MQNMQVKLPKEMENQKKIAAKWIKCRNCRKLFTQTIVRKKVSDPICPHCKTHNK